MAMAKHLIAAALFLAASFASAQNNTQATPSPRNLAEAAGLYAGATAFVIAVKASTCGFAITREAPALSVVVRNDIAPRFPAAQQDEAYQALMGMEQNMMQQGRTMLSSLYNNYVKTDGIDHRTACGFVAGTAISAQKLAKESMSRFSGRQ